MPVAMLVLLTLLNKKGFNWTMNSSWRCQSIKRTIVTVVDRVLRKNINHSNVNIVILSNHKSLKIVEVARARPFSFRHSLKHSFLTTLFSGNCFPQSETRLKIIRFQASIHLPHHYRSIKYVYIYWLLKNKAISAKKAKKHPWQKSLLIGNHCQ